MNLIEALKAGKYIRRPVDKHRGVTRTGWLCADYIVSILIADEVQFSGSYCQKLINKTDLLANDWEATNDTTR